VTSLARRLAAVLLVSEALLAVALALIASTVVHRQLKAAFEAQLRARAVGLAALVRYTETDPPTLYFDATLTPPPLDARYPDLYELTTTAGRHLAGTPNWNGFAVKSHNGRFKRSGLPYQRVELRGLRVLDAEEGSGPPPTLAVAYASPTVELDARLRRLEWLLALTALGALALTISASLHMAKRLLRPAADLAAEAEKISAQNWRFYPPAEANRTAELRPLTDALGLMLRRLERAFEQQKEFTANAAHELKTPVATLKSTLQLLSQRPRDAQDYRAGVSRALEDVFRLEALLSRLLHLARLEQSAVRSGSTASVTALEESCDAALERMQPMALVRNIRLQREGEAVGRVRANPEDLELVWLNLLENAIQFSPEGETVTLRLSEAPGRAIVEVLDRGPGIPLEELPRIFERFHRGDPSRSRATGGFGLGLAIVKEVVESCGGTVAAGSDHGTCVSVSLPVVESAPENPGLEAGPSPTPHSASRRASP
jgi:signal transduction histidine kinase